MNEDELEKYVLIAKTNRFKKLVEETHKEIDKALEISKSFYLSYSSGKDSTVLLDLLSRHHWSQQALHMIASKYEDPEENIILSKKAEQNYNITINRVDCYGEYDAWKEVGHFFIKPDAREEKRCANKANNDFKKVAEMFSVENGLPNRFMGVTKAESRAREINIAVRGKTYQLTNGTYASNPLANWKNEDIWAYIAINNLDYLSVYDKQLFKKRELIRNELTVLYQNESLAREILVMYRYAYPLLFKQLIAEFPEARAFV